MADTNRVHAPYNFVPFSNRVMVRYAAPEDLPPHDRIDPELKTGEIHVTLRAETPVFVGDGNEQFFQDAAGRYAIPGASLRGLIRENMQILGMGLVRGGEDVEDVQIFFRKMADAKGSVNGQLKTYYHEVLGVETRKAAGGPRDQKGKPKTSSIPKHVRAGWLRKDGNTYIIYPVRGGYLRISRKDELAAPWKDAFARYVDVAYRTAGDRIAALTEAGKAEPDMKRGVLLCTGKYVGREPNHLYLFPEEPDPEAEPVEVSAADILSYTADWEGRVNSLKGFRYDPGFWALPREGEKKAVFYTRFNGHTFFGMSLYLRVGHRFPLSAGLPDKHKALAEEETPVLDYPHAVLGFAGKQDAYRSRVSFSDLPVRGEAQTAQEVKVILGQPKPSYFPGYVRKGDHYSEEEGFQLRGYKQYWMKEKADPPAAEQGKEKVSSTLRPLSAGTVFSGVVRYRNLHEDELGLLLWALRLEKGCFQSVGMGKPYGFGRMTLTVDALREYRPEELYRGFGTRTSEPDGGAVERYISAYVKYVDQAFRKPGAASGKKKGKDFSLREQGWLRDFLFLRSSVRPAGEMGYMELE